ncbi:hypothetical protein GCM10023194_80790 [Planotetraspora phitsanulokensis]|uniref:Uncharacterized protein n=1 Tax=Planotetraspora phitsanulokensis TaxID=575192 RepID=A0A8J3UIC7_9ACTN|nr:hypothetical protein [Planotetraspora phitsanulokensis]GII42839.1 hypothetical protein Pph01_78420 [Planotetraspora phitsanulokensis]
MSDFTPEPSRQRNRKQQVRKKGHTPRVAVWSPDGTRLMAVLEARNLTPEDLDAAYALASRITPEVTPDV